ncbi:hypothetical protein ScPMuIL_011779 [Solemya velum]
MATPTEFRSSPFNNVFQIVPQGHEKAIKQAFYNTAATLFLIIACAAALSVFFILQAFLRPLAWAVLCGTFLYPFKRKLTNVLRSWLRGLDSSGTPILVGIAVIPVQVLNRTADVASDTFLGHWRVILCGAVAVPVLYSLWHFGLVSSILYALQSTFLFVYEVLDYFSSLWIWTIVIAYLLLVVFLWNSDSKRYLRYLSVPVWFAAIFHISTAAGVLRVPLLIFMVTVIGIGFVSEVLNAQKEYDEQGCDVSPSAVQTACDLLFDGESDTETVPKTGEKTMETDAPRVIERVEKTVTYNKPTSLKIKKDEKECPVRDDSDNAQVDTDTSLSDRSFIALFWAVVVSRLWIHMWILWLLLPIFIAIWIIKALAARLTGEGMLGDRFKSCKSSLQMWFTSRKSVLAPRWIQGLLKLISKGDRKIISILEQSLDKATSILFILLLLVGTTSLTVFFAIQVQQESMHIVQVTSNLLNNTLHPDISHWLPNGDDMQEAMDSMVGNAYLYGRNWIAVKVREYVNPDGTNDTQIEQQVLDIWDRMYESWLARNAIPSSPSTEKKDDFQWFSGDVTSLKSVWEFITNWDGFNDIVVFVKDNIGTFMSVLESIWAVLMGNMNIVFSILASSVSILFGGGTAVLNFVISTAIFLTTLFYLLASSGDQYKPVEWFSSMSPSQSGSRFGQAVEEAVSGVFMATVKMGAFYGIYTWLTHTFFGINIVFIPSALAAVFGAVPFVGTYWAAFPACLELWLVQGEWIQALLLLIIHMLPTYVVDTAILSEIKGGHPYITGLAIAGGLFWLGLEGAVMGPILLCFLIVLVNVYSSMMQPDSSSTTPTAGEVLLKDVRSAMTGRTWLWKSRRSLSSDVMKSQLA